MKTSLIIIFLMTVSATVFSQSRSMGSQGVLGKVQNVIDLAEDHDLEVVRIEADIIRDTKETIRSLDPSFTYTITAVGSDRIEDIDIEVYKKIGGAWTLIEKDDDESNLAVVTVRPSTFSDYKIVVKAYQFYSGYEVGHYGLIFVHN